MSNVIAFNQSMIRTGQPIMAFENIGDLLAFLKIEANPVLEAVLGRGGKVDLSKPFIVNTGIGSASELEGGVPYYTPTIPDRMVYAVQVLEHGVLFLNRASPPSVCLANLDGENVQKYTPDEEARAKSDLVDWLEETRLDILDVLNWLTIKNNVSVDESQAWSYVFLANNIMVHLFEEIIAHISNENEEDTFMIKFAKTQIGSTGLHYDLIKGEREDE